MIGLGFKYLTQDNYHREKMLPFLVLKLFKKKNLETVLVSLRGMQDKTRYGGTLSREMLEKSKYKASLTPDT